MRKKKIVIILLSIFLVSVIVGLAYYFIKKKEQNDILVRTNIISQEYLKLRYQTNVLLDDASSYPSYEAWEMELEYIIMRWENLEGQAKFLKEEAEGKSDSISYRLINTAKAYTAKEITEVYDSAPLRSTGVRPIVFLADQLGTDAKRAFEILKIAQAQMESEAWDEAGDTFEILQNSAQTIQAGCKITAYVGGAILSGGTTTTVGAVLGSASLVASGADLVLEIGETTSKIAVGYNSDAVAFFDSIRTYTKPPAAILGFANTFYDYSNWGDWERISAIIFTGDQLTSLMVDDEIAGVEIEQLAGFVGLVFDFGDEPGVEVAVLESDEQKKEWFEDNNIGEQAGDPSEILHIDELGVGNVELVVVSDEGNELTEEELQELENKMKLQEELVTINDKLVTGVLSCYGSAPSTYEVSDNSELRIEKQSCINDCKQYVSTVGGEWEVCSTTDSRYPTAVEELKELRNSCKERCKPQYEYLLKIEQQNGSNTNRKADLKEWLAGCPERCDKVCIPLKSLSYSDCLNGCTYRYSQSLRASVINISGDGTTETLQCKRQVIMEIQMEIQQVLSKYGYTIDDF